MSRIFSSTVFLLTVTIAAKSIGFVRELILLENLGIGSEIDMFLILYGIVSLLTGALGLCVVTSLTPLAARYTTRSAVLALMGEGLQLGLKIALVAIAVTLTYVALAAPSLGRTTYLLAVVIPGVVPLSLLAEYQVSLFLSRGWRLPVIAGNLIISLPLVIALLIADLGIVAYSVGLVLSFGLRAGIFGFLLMRNSPESVESPTSAKTDLFGRRIGYTLAGGSAMLAVSVIYLTAQIAAQQMGPGEATIIGYGLKVPLLILTSVWFVLGTGYFSDIVTKGTSNVVARIFRLSALNSLFLIFIAGFILLVRQLNGDTRIGELLSRSETIEVISQSLPFLPIIVTVPVIEMVQRLVVAEDRHWWVPAVAGATLLSGLLIQGIGYLTASVSWLAWSPAVGTFVGFIVALGLLRGFSQAQR